MRYGYVLAALLLVGGGVAAVNWIKGDPAKQADAQGGRGSGKRGGQNSAPVAVAKVKKQSVPVYRDGIGNVQALYAVTARAQVDGRLMSVEFQEGQDVKKGDVLARIDPSIYKSLYDQAVAKKAQDEANLANARLDLERYRHLAQTNAGPKQQADQQQATVAQLEAQVQSDQAMIDNTRTTLDFTTIVAPLDGRVGLRLVDPGNIVKSSDQTGIVSIAQLKPIAVVFTLPQRELAVTAAAFARGPVTVEIPGDDGKPIATGILLSLDNQIDTSTGTIKLKARFDNDKLTLWPGQFVSVRAVVDTLADAKVVPSSAIRRGVAGNYVYTISPDMTAVVNPVTVALQDDAIAVVSAGLDYDQQIITEGFAQLSEGKAVVIGGDAPGDGAKRGKRGDKAKAADGKADPAAPKPSAPGPAAKIDGGKVDGTASQAAPTPATGRREANAEATPAPSVATPAFAAEAASPAEGDGKGDGKRGRRNRDGGIETGSAPAAEGAAGPAARSTQGNPGARP